MCQLVQKSQYKRSQIFRAQELCESRGGRLGLPVRNKPTVSVDVKQHFNNNITDCNVSRFGLAVRRWAGKRTTSVQFPVRLYPLSSRVVVGGHCLVTLPLSVNETLN